MGALDPAKMPKGKRKPRRDCTEFDEYARSVQVQRKLRKRGPQDYRE
jgi:hypothetical protein